MTLDMEDHTTTDATLATLRELRKDFPEIGAVLQAYLRRTEADCRDLATGARACGCARARTTSRQSVAFQSRLDVDSRTCGASRC